MIEITLSESDVIAIGDPASPDPPIEVTVTDLTDVHVRLGITAKAEVQVHRTEIYEDILENGRREPVDHSR